MTEEEAKAQLEQEAHKQLRTLQDLCAQAGFDLSDVASAGITVASAVMGHERVGGAAMRKTAEMLAENTKESKKRYAAAAALSRAVSVNLAPVEVPVADLEGPRTILEHMGMVEAVDMGGNIRDVISDLLNVPVNTCTRLFMMVLADSGGKVGDDGTYVPMMPQQQLPPAQARAKAKEVLKRCDMMMSEAEQDLVILATAGDRKDRVQQERQRETQKESQTQKLAEREKTAAQNLSAKTDKVLSRIPGVSRDNLDIVKWFACQFCPDSKDRNIQVMASLKKMAEGAEFTTTDLGKLGCHIDYRRLHELNNAYRSMVKQKYSQHDTNCFVRLHCCAINNACLKFLLGVRWESLNNNDGVKKAGLESSKLWSLSRMEYQVFGETTSESACRSRGTMVLEVDGMVKELANDGKYGELSKIVGSMSRSGDSPDGSPLKVFEQLMFAVITEATMASCPQVMAPVEAAHDEVNGGVASEKGIVEFSHPVLFTYLSGCSDHERLMLLGLMFRLMQRQHEAHGNADFDFHDMLGVLRDNLDDSIEDLANGSLKRLSLDSFSALENHNLLPLLLSLETGDGLTPVSYSRSIAPLYMALPTPFVSAAGVSILLASKVWDVSCELGVNPFTVCMKAMENGGLDETDADQLDKIVREAARTLSADGLSRLKTRDVSFFGGGNWEDVVMAYCDASTSGNTLVMLHRLVSPEDLPEMVEPEEHLSADQGLEQVSEKGKILEKARAARAHLSTFCKGERHLFDFDLDKPAAIRSMKDFMRAAQESNKENAERDLEYEWGVAWPELEDAVSDMFDEIAATANAQTLTRCMVKAASHPLLTGKGSVGDLSSHTAGIGDHSVLVDYVSSMIGVIVKKKLLSVDITADDDGSFKHPLMDWCGRPLVTDELLQLLRKTVVVSALINIASDTGLSEECDMTDNWKALTSPLSAENAMSILDGMGPDTKAEDARKMLWSSDEPPCCVKVSAQMLALGRAGFKLTVHEDKQKIVMPPGSRMPPGYLKGDNAQKHIAMNVGSLGLLIARMCVHNDKFPEALEKADGEFDLFPERVAEHFEMG